MDRRDVGGASRRDAAASADLVRAALLGTISPVDLRTYVAMHGLDPAAEYVAFRAHTGGDCVRERLEERLGMRDAGHGLPGLWAPVYGDLAGFLIESPQHNVDGVVGVGPLRPLERLVESYRLAVRALATAKAFGLNGAHDIASFGIRSAVAIDPEMGELLRARYLDPLAAAGSADDLIDTLRIYLSCGMRADKAATRLLVHHNTVRYRLARFEELTGANLRRAEVLVEVWWALESFAVRP